MKIIFHVKNWIIRVHVWLALVWLIAFAPDLARANTDLDRQYALETVGFLRAWDNVDGLFADYVASAYKDYFSRTSRFTLQDLSRAEPLLEKSKLPYTKIIEDDKILAQIAKSTRSQSIIRTRIYKEGPTYRFTQEWLHSPRIDLLSKTSFTLAERREGGATGLPDVKTALQRGLDELIGKVPFVAQVTGRDEESVTINIGANSGLKRGDTLVVATLDEVKRHPLLKEVVDWRLTETGRLEVEEVDEAISFCRVIEQHPGRQIGRYQKIAQVFPAKAPEQPSPRNDEEDHARELQKAPTFGWASAGLWLGSFSRDYTSTTQGRTGSGFLLGAKADGQLWLTRLWFAELGLGYGFSGYSQTSTATGASSSVGDAGASVTTFKLSAGYTYYPTPSFSGPKGWLRLGYGVTSYGLPQVPAEFVSPVSFNGLFLGIGGDLPLRNNFGATMNFDFGLFNSASETGSGAVSAGASSVHFFLGGYYNPTRRMSWRAGIDFTANNADFLNSSVAHRVIGFGPSLLYYF